MKKIVIHWTAGGAVPTCYEKEHYHFLVDSLGNVHNGKFKPEANLKCVNGLYAAHTGGGNTGSIGVAMCGMMGYLDKNHIGNFPITRKQFEATMKLCAELSVKYKIPVAKDYILTHYEFGRQHPETSSRGKIDIVFLPPFSWLKKEEVGGFIRSKIRWYLEQIKNK